jgi:hypothetical protein
VNTGEIAWSFSTPKLGESFTIAVNDTFHVGATAWFQRGHTTTSRPREFNGSVILDFHSCELYTRIYPSKSDSFFKVRPGLADSLVDGYPDGGWQPFGTARVAAGGISSSTPVVLADTIPLLPPTDSDVGTGYAPTGYGAYVSFWRPLAAPITMTLTATPSP